MRDLLSQMDLAINRAKQYLMEQAIQCFAETRHTMYFPSRAGFRVRSEQQSSDIFARAVLASTLMDIADLDVDLGSRGFPLGETQFVAFLREVIRRETDYVAQAKLRDRMGGWSYFPNLPELPPDLDSLAAALRLFARSKSEYSSICEEPIAVALGNLQPDGALKTWIISPSDEEKQKQLMKRGIKRFWGDSVDVDVCAHFFLAMWEYDRDRYGDLVRRGGQFILSQQKPNGVWVATWYHGYAYTMGLCFRLLQELGIGEEAISRAVAFLIETQMPDGGWYVWETDPQETALAIWAIGNSGEMIQEAASVLAKLTAEVIERAVRYLLDRQTHEGQWKGWPWIKMDVGQVCGRTTHTLTYMSATMTTAFCLRSLLLARRWLTK